MFKASCTWDVFITCPERFNLTDSDPHLERPFCHVYAAVSSVLPCLHLEVFLKKNFFIWAKT